MGPAATTRAHREGKPTCRPRPGTDDRRPLESDTWWAAPLRSQRNGSAAPAQCHRHLQALRPCRGARRRRLRGPRRRGRRLGRRQRRRQVDADQGDRRGPARGLGHDHDRRRAREHPQRLRRLQARDRDRLPGSRALRQPRRRREPVPGRRAAERRAGSRRAGDGATDGRAPRLARRDLAGERARGRPLGRPAPVGGDRTLAPRRPRCDARRAEPRSASCRPRRSSSWSTACASADSA